MALTKTKKKFEVMITEHIQRSVTYTLVIDQEDVVNAMGLAGADANEWVDHVDEYLINNWDELRNHEGVVRGDVDEGDVNDFDVDSVTEL